LNQVNLGQSPPFGISPQQLQAGRNNDEAWALASADPRFAVKAYDKPGLSRGGGQWNQAGIDAAKTLSEGIAAAYGNSLQNSVANAGSQLQGQTQQENSAQALAALQQQQAYGNQMSALQRQQMIANMYSGLLGGLFT
jgi:hypothetical protein